MKDDLTQAYFLFMSFFYELFKLIHSNDLNEFDEGEISIFGAILSLK